MNRTSPTLRRPLASPPRKQGGFAMFGLLLLAVGAVVALGVYMAAGVSQDTGKIQEMAAKTSSSTLGTDGSTLKGAVTQLAADGVSIDSVTLDTNATTGIYSPGPGGVTPPRIQPTWLGTGTVSTAWARGAVVLPGVSSATSDQVFVLPNISLPLCREVNRKAYGTTNIPATPISVADWSNPTAEPDLSATVAITGWDRGCVTPSGAATGNALYFHVYNAR